MTRTVALSCLHLMFTIDRIEANWAVVEWWGTTATTDIELTLFPSKPNEGGSWIVHMIPGPSGTGEFDTKQHAYRFEKGWLFLPEEYPKKPLERLGLRMSRMPKTTPMGGKKHER